jgi:NHL repeat
LKGEQQMEKIWRSLMICSVVLLLPGLLAACSGTSTPGLSTTSATATPQRTATSIKGSGNDHKGFPLYGSLNDFLSVDVKGNLFVMDTDYNNFQGVHARILELSPTGRILKELHPFSSCAFVQGLAVDEHGNIYATDGNSILKLSPTGEVHTSWSVDAPVGVVIDHHDHIYVTLYSQGQIQKFSSTGELLATWGKNGKNPAQFSNPGGIAVDAQDNISIADTGNARVQKLSSSCKSLATWGSSGSDPGQFEEPNSVAVDQQGNVYVADRGNSLLEKFSPAGHFLNSVQFN